MKGGMQGIGCLCS